MTAAPESAAPGLPPGAALFFLPTPTGIAWLRLEGDAVTETGDRPAVLAIPAWLAREAEAGFAPWTWSPADADAAGCGLRALQPWSELLRPEWDSSSSDRAAASAGLAARGVNAFPALVAKLRERWETVRSETVAAAVPVLETSGHQLSKAWALRAAALLTGELKQKLKAPVRPRFAPRPAADPDFRLEGSAAWFAAAGPLVAGWGMEHRPPQERMAALVEAALNDSTFLAVEAGCGIGKSLAYGIPLFRWCAGSRGQAVISTNTRNLQNQLFTKDFPFIAKLLAGEGKPVTFALLKGRENYLCSRRLHQLLRRSAWNLAGATLLVGVLVWEQFSPARDLNELPRLTSPGSGEWYGELAAAADTCLGKRCYFKARCHVRAARETAAAADLVLVNHALLLADAAADAPLLPPYSRLVVDEAHHLERAAAENLGVESNFRGLWRLGQRLIGEGRPGDRGLLHELAGRFPVGDPVARTFERLRLDFGAARDRAGEFFRLLQGRYFADGESPSGRVRLHPGKFAPGFPLDEWREVNAGLDAVSALAAAVRKAGQALDEDEVAGEFAAWAMSFANWAGAFGLFGRLDDDRFVYWLERGRGSQAEMVAAPRAVGPFLKAALFDRLATAVFTSATLTVGDDFSFWRERTGLGGEDKLRCEKLPEIFEYDRQVRAGAVRFVPAIGNPDYIPTVAAVIARAAELTTGGVLALFTSHRVLKETQRELRERLAPERLLVHGVSGSREQLLDRFRVGAGDVLLGTASFWEGIDVPGDALQTVIVVKLPFSVPDDPLVEAHGEDLAAAGRDPFRDYMVPLMALRLRQGYGRLIRTKDDRGFFLLLDERAFTRDYRREINEVLPHSQWTTVQTLAQLPAFFAGEPLGEEEAGDDEELARRFDRLRRLRSRLAAGEKVPPFKVFPDATLKALVLAAPRTLEEFATVKGIGEKKLEKYGTIFLAALQSDSDD